MDLWQRVLILETSGRVGDVALAAAGSVVAARQLEEARRHARDLAAATAELLRERGWRAGDLSAILVSLGPGSFTGLRVGLASAKALAYAVGCPLLGVPTFQAVVRQSAADSRYVAVVADALQGMAYVEVYARAADGAYVPVEPLAVHPFAEWLAKKGEEVRMTGPGVATFRDHLTCRTNVAPPGEWRPRPDSLLAAAAEQADHWRCDPVLIEPIYVRPSSAEEKRERSSR